ncbi:phosphonoacetaldehyde hydrolase [Elioraea rosea]|uniref:phosphonoacetaldehyde hydrolase n=1 Tax=Elioraea rosea TaxID=2492390 RepID=UPI001185837C|nr:phosphonoacetaldehyde hydrolase [Elioraea rosea]
MPAPLYAGPIKAVVLDWAGTVVDHGSRAPMGAFVRAFGAFGVTIDIVAARAPMGLPKWDHIWAVGTTPRVAEAWRARHGRDFDKNDADEIFAVFEPMNTASVRDHADMIPGAVEAIAALRARGLRIGSTTGYTRPIMDVLAPIAAAAGYAPDNIVCAGDLAAGRPTPLMMYRCFADLGVWPAAAVVKVDDTEPGIAEGIAAGCWTVGVSLSGNGAGLSAEELAALPASERDALRERAAAPLRAAGAHLVIDSIATLPDAVATLSARAERGEAP